MPIKYYLNQDNEYVCQVCGETKRLQSTMHYHMKKHEEAKPYNCKLCNYGCLQKCTLDHHMKAKHPDQQTTTDQKKQTIKCPHKGCDFESLTKANCRIHFLRKHCKELIDEVLEGKSTCKSCGKEHGSTTAFYYHAVSCIAFEEGDKRIPQLQSVL